MEELNRDIVFYVWDNLCDTIYHYTVTNKKFWAKIIIRHIRVVTKLYRTLTIYFISRIAKLYIFIVLISIRNIYVNWRAESYVWDKTDMQNAP